MVNFVDHDHEGEWVPPNTIGGTDTRQCTECGIYETRPSSVSVDLSSVPPFFQGVKPNRTSGTAFDE